MIAAVKILALPVHLVGDDRLARPGARAVVGQEQLALPKMGGQARQVDPQRECAKPDAHRAGEHHRQLPCTRQQQERQAQRRQ